MVTAATDMTGWWIGYGLGALVVVIVVAVVVAIIVSARKIGDVAEDATRALVQTRDRTEVLWQVATTNTLAHDLLRGATQAREALGGGDGDERHSDRTHEISRDLGAVPGRGTPAAGVPGVPPPRQLSREDIP